MVHKVLVAIDVGKKNNDIAARLIKNHGIFSLMLGHKYINLSKILSQEEFYTLLSCG
jgi:hypothetical protein